MSITHHHSLTYLRLNRKENYASYIIKHILHVMFLTDVFVELRFSGEALRTVFTAKRSSVSQYMRLQVRLPAERFPTLVTVKGANAWVLQHVVFQVRCLFEGGVTLATGELPLITVRFLVLHHHWPRLEALRTKRTLERSLFWVTRKVRSEAVFRPKRLATHKACTQRFITVINFSMRL